jgi:hypothetical protein
MCRFAATQGQLSAQDKDKQHIMVYGAFQAYYGVPAPWLGTPSQWQDCSVAVLSNCWNYKQWFICSNNMALDVDPSGNNSNVLIAFWDDTVNGTAGACFLRMCLNDYEKNLNRAYTFNSQRTANTLCHHQVPWRPMYQTF